MKKERLKCSITKRDSQVFFFRSIFNKTIASDADYTFF